MSGKITIATISLLLFLLSSCGGGQQQEAADTGAESDTTGMAQFADDEKFKAAHGEPTELNFEGRGEMMEFDTPDGQTGSAYTLEAATESNKYLFVIHEWWGLNEHIKAEAERLYDILDSTVTVMAPDMYDGKVATSQDSAQQYMQSLNQDRGYAIINGAINQTGAEARIGTIGWCFGGGWSLRTAIEAGDKGAGCVMYYGMPVDDAEALEPITCDILGIFARQDEWINEKVVNGFKEIAQEAGADLEVHWFDAAHAFANPSNPEYDAEAAKEANNLAWGFLEERL